LFPQGAVLLLKIVDRIALLLAHPTGECDEYEQQRRRHGNMTPRLPKAMVIDCLAPDP